MKRHASADELADLAAGILRPRKARKISAHLSGCAFCTDVSNQLANVSSLLATVPVAPMPANLSSKIGARLPPSPRTGWRASLALNPDGAIACQGHAPAAERPRLARPLTIRTC